MNKKMKILLAIMIVGQLVMAADVYSTQKLIDGTYIRMCRYSNGKIDYCTHQDAMKAIDVFNNPLKYMTPQQKAQWEKSIKETKAKIEAEQKAEIAAKLKKETTMKEVVPNSIILSKAIDNMRTAMIELENKQNAGVDVSEEMNLLRYKEKKLSTLYNASYEHENAYSNLLDGTITQTEYNKIAITLKEKDAALKVPYEQIMSMTSEDIAKEIAEAKAKEQAEAKKEKKMQARKQLLDYGSLFLPANASNFVKQGVNMYEGFSK